MSLELHLRESSLAQALTAYVQTQLFTMCGPAASPALLVDHVDTVPGSVTVSDAPDGRLDVRLDLAVHTVTRAQVLAHPNAVPPMNPVVSIGVVVRLAASSQALVIESASCDASAAPLPPVLRAALEAAVDTRLTPLAGTTLIDLAPVVTALGSQVPSEPSLGHAGGVLGLRFGGSGAFTPHLGDAQAWGVFLDADEAIALLTRQQPEGLPARVRWLPDGATPALEASLTISTLVAGAAVTVTARPTLVPPSTLRMSVAWGLNLTGVPFFLEPLARKLAREWVRRQFRNATHDGAQSFYFDFALPAVPALLGAEPQWRTIDSSPAGMTIGGPVRPALEGNRGVLTATTGRFGRPAWWGNCRRDGEPPRHFMESSATVRVQAGVNFTDAGRLCDAQVLPPNEWLLPQSAGVNGLSFDLSVGTAKQVTDDVTLFLRTARGTRFIDLGRPVVRQRPDGSGLDVQVNWFDNCLTLSGAWLKLALGEPLGPGDYGPFPLEDEDWITILGARQGLVSHLVVLGRLDAGEVVTVRAHNLALELTADESGELSVPALVALSTTGREVVLERAGGDLVEGTIRVQGTHLTWLAELGPAHAAAVSDIGEGALVVRDVDGVLTGVEYRPAEGVVPVDLGGAVQLNPQPLPPEPPESMRLAAAAGLTDVRGAHALPGVDAGRVAVARLGDGQRVVVTTDGGTPHVAGSYQGPVVGMLVDGRYALARSGGAVHLFAVTPLADVSM